MFLDLAASLGLVLPRKHLAPVFAALAGAAGGSYSTEIDAVKGRAEVHGGGP